MSVLLNKETDERRLDRKRGRRSRCVGAWVREGEDTWVREEEDKTSLPLSYKKNK
jgi:hypothetical protein